MPFSASARRRLQDPSVRQAALLRRGNKLLSAGRHDEAAAVVLAASGKGADAAALRALSKLLRRTGGDPQTAHAAYLAAAALNGGPLSPDIEYDHGIEAACAGAAAEAEQHFRIALAGQPGWPDAAYALASLLAARGALAEADAIFASGLDLICGNGHPTTTHMLRLPLPGRPLGWPISQRKRPARTVALPSRAAADAATAHMVYLIAADSRYLGLFARPLLSSLERVGSGRVLLHVHAVNPDEPTVALLEDLRGGAVPVGISTEQATLDDMDDMQRRVFYSCCRYLVLPELLKMYGRPVLVADADQLVLRPPETLLPLLDESDVALLRFKNLEHNILGLISATLMLIDAGPDGLRFAEAVRAWLLARMAEEKGLAWHLDQAALAVASLGVQDVRLGRLDPRLVHLAPDAPDPGSPATFWSITMSTAENIAKMDSTVFRTLAAGGHEEPTDRLWAKGKPDLAAEISS